MKNKKLKEILTKEYLTEEYSVKKRSPLDIAEGLGISEAAVYIHLAKNNIERDRKTLGRLLTKEYLEQEFVKNQKTKAEIAKELNCTRAIVGYYLNKFEFSKPQPSTLHNQLTKEFLIEEYFNKGRTTKDIAKELGCRFETVREYLKKYGLKKRKYNENLEDLIGKKFGRLLVLQLSEKQMRHGRRWLCQCDCGVKKDVSTSALNSAGTVSCGCYYKDNYHKGYGEISGNYWNDVVAGAKLRGLELTVTLQYVWELFLKQDRKCALSGVLLKFDNRKGKYQSASLDRIDSKKGYTTDNVQWVHKRINLMKHSMSDKMLMYWCAKVYEYNKDKISIDDDSEKYDNVLLFLNKEPV